MLVAGHPHTVRPGEGPIADLGITRMRVLAAGDATTARAFTLAEFTGGAGPWTVPHLHRAMEESFFVLDGDFTFTVGDERVEAGPGCYVLVPRGTRHLVTAGPDGGRCLVLMVPGGQEDMFFELARLGPDALRDPGVRAAVSARYDSVPVT
jgi:quercetin dioxygenase-like cupin family protein